MLPMHPCVLHHIFLSIPYLCTTKLVLVFGWEISRKFQGCRLDWEVKKMLKERNSKPFACYSQETIGMSLESR